MNLHARIELYGGPEDGREITLPVSGEGEPLSPLPVPRASEENEGVAWYERDQHMGRGFWVYKYSDSQSAEHPQAG
ncbi:hypothetical protein SAMN04487904_104260 [Actinopolyspora lacussalsi subsp. righensis]|uniref:Uncharacterized protein n=1 Tax=Actinopolyspora righensis TaxID=995060 RepID=A0A1I6ZE97_9ACTN|nr:hypothetical protein [Actinopolyspora righensis]SFT60988.1 hypothetical protein SAMN04487904_104260 [Actinopolyspora righensis]